MTSGEWVFYDLPWWAPWLWAYAVYATGRFALAVVVRRIKRRRSR